MLAFAGLSWLACIRLLVLLEFVCVDLVFCLRLFAFACLHPLASIRLLTFVCSHPLVCIRLFALTRLLAFGWLHSLACFRLLTFVGIRLLAVAGKPPCLQAKGKPLRSDWLAGWLAGLFA